MKNIKSKIQEELQEFDRDITIIDNWNFNQRRTIQQSILYFNSKFVDGDMVDGFKQFFFNVVRPACGTTTKAIDIDTKDIILMTAPGGSSIKTWFLQRSLNNWFKRKKFGKILNRISEELPIYGSVVLKKVKDDVKFVNLKNFICEQNADTLDQSNYIIEQHLYTPIEFMKIGKEKRWDNVKEIIDLYKGSKEQYIRVFERYGLCKDGDELKYKMILVADIPTDIKLNKQQEIEINESIVLASEEIETHPYFEIHMFKVPGRWLGCGIPELLEDPQIRLNEITNQEARSSYWAAKRIWQTRDPGVKRNLLGKSKDGDVLCIDEEINPVPMEDRNTYATYSAQTEKWKANTQELTFSYDVIRGQRTPAGTPLGSAQLSAYMSLSYFDQIKENIALDIKELLYSFILPSFEKYASKEHIIRIAGEDIDKLSEMIVETRARKKFFDFLLRNNKIPSPEERDIMKEIILQQIKGKGEFMIKIDGGWLKDTKYDVDIVITDESIDATTQASNLIQGLQAIAQNPGFLQDPTQKKFFAKYLESGGINLYDMEASAPKEPLSVVADMATTTPMGGGISAPQQVRGAPSLRERTLRV